MKLVLLEVFIVVVATRAVMCLLGTAMPAWPNPLWVTFAVISVVATAAVLVGEVRKRLRRRLAANGPVFGPRIPLDRIAPFTEDALVVRYGAAGRPNIHLN